MRLPTLAIAVAPSASAMPSAAEPAAPRGIELGQEQQCDAGDAEGRRKERTHRQRLAVDKAHADRAHEHDGREDHRDEPGRDIALGPVHTDVVESEQRRTEGRQNAVLTKRKAQRLRVARHHAASMRLASAKRYATDSSGATVPSWNVMASHVEPQMRLDVRNSAALDDRISATRR